MRTVLIATDAEANKHSEDRRVGFMRKSVFVIKTCLRRSAERL